MQTPMLCLALLAGLAHPKVLVAHPRGAAPIVIDGKLDEPAWRAAPVGGDFIERTPTPGAPSPAESTVRVLFDADAIYVGVRMLTLPGETPKAFELRRDNGGIWSFDAVTVKIDPRLDRRTTLGFAVNPAGARIDLIALDNGKVFRVEHDSVWDVATSVDAAGWTAEYRIPATALGVRASDGEQRMGLEVSRDHAVRVATDDWAPLPPGFGPVSALHYGELRGVRGLGAGRPFALIPYGLGAWEDGDPRGGVGGEARVQIGTSGQAELSVRTDFAEVDLDDALVNLDRFPLFFPERRPFFLNGLDVFEFGESGFTQLFFSRRIGLDPDGAQVPIHTGLKVFQRDGRVRGGALSVLTADHAGRSAALWSVGRGRAEVADGHAGAMLVHRADVPTLGDGATGPSHLGLGLDGQLRAFDTRLQIAGSGALTANSGRESTADGPNRLKLGGTAALKTQWRGRNFRPSLNLFRVDDTYDPQVGFLRRGDIAQAESRLAWYWLNPTPTLKSVSIDGAGFVLTDADLEAQQGLGGASNLRVDWMSGWGVQSGIGWDTDRVASAFELADRVTVPAGDYDGVLVDLYVNSPYARTPDFELGLVHDRGYFGGQRNGGSLSGGWYLNSHVRIGGDLRLNHIDLPGADAFWTTAINSSLTITPSPTWVIDTVGQFNSVSERISGLMRLRWRWQPGSDLFVVYREAFDAGASVDRRVTLKLTWWIDGLL